MLINKLAIVLALFAWSSSSYAQQPTECNSCGCTVPSMLGATYSTSTSPAAIACPTNGAINMNVGRFLRFWGAVGNVYSFSLCGQPGNTSLYVMTNTAVPAVITCDQDGCGVPNGPALVTFIPAANALYRLYVFNSACPATYPDNTMMSVVMNCSPAQVPVNNNPCTATVLPTTSSTCNYTSGSNLGATNSGLAPPSVCNSANSLYQGADVWYQVQVPANGLLGIQTEEGDICAGMFQLYTSNNNNCNGTLSEVANGCSAVGLTGPLSEPALIFDAFAAGLTAGQPIWIRYWERNGNENGSFSICAFEAERPPNDEPCAATALPLNTSCVTSSYTFTNAGPSTVPAPGCGNTSNTSDVWFTFTVPTVLPPNWTGITVGTVDNDLLNLAMAWYRLTATPCTPASLQEIACSATGSINSANVNPNLLVPGETIYVRLWNEAPWIGTYDICAVINQAPANDDPCGAIALNVNYGCLMQTFSNSSATTTITAYAPNPTCGTPATNDVWFTATMPATGPLQIDMLAGGMTNAAMAAYTGTCSALQAIPGACAIAGSQQGTGSNQMPYLSINGPAPGSTVYIRVWRQGGADGTFGICARRTDNPPGNCFYTLSMYDTAGDGWGGSFVTICVAGNCTNYTVNGLSAGVSIGVNIGQTFTVSYTSGGGFENQNSYSITQYNLTVFSTNSPPQTGLVYSETVSCTPPPAPQSDCFGAMQVCDQFPDLNQQAIPGTQELNTTNRGCLLGNEHWGLWYSLTVETAGNIEFTIDPAVNMDYDFAVWGPYPPGSTTGNICPPTTAPLRCNFSGVWGNTGLQVNPTTSPYSPHIVANVGEVYLLYIDQWTGGSNYQYDLIWGTAPTNADFTCSPLSVEMLSFDAQPEGEHVLVDWATAAEQNSAWFNVERSIDGVEFDAIGQVAAAGNSQSINRYQFVDDAPHTGLSYYRLEEVDIAGASGHSNIVAVLMHPGNTLQVYPNPAEDMLTLSIMLEKENMLQWRITDMSGRIVRTATVAGGLGRNIEDISVYDLDQGSYVLEVQDLSGNTLGNARFIKQ